MAATKKKLLICGVATLVLLFAALAILTSGSGASLPNPNGYDAFVKAGQTLTPSLGDRYLSEYREMSLDELHTFAATNTEALKMLRTGLGQKSCVPIQNSRQWFRDHLGEMSTFKHLAFMLCLEGRLAELEGRTNDALNVRLDLVRFAHESARGGMILDAAVSWTLEAIALRDMKTIQSALDAKQSRQAAKVIEEVDAKGEPWSNFSKRDLRYTIQAELTSIFSLDSWRAQRRHKGRFYQAQARRRQAILDFAARAYELEKGELPKTINDLVPAYLKTIPQDPLTGTNILYLP